MTSVTKEDIELLNRIKNAVGGAELEIGYKIEAVEFGEMFDGTDTLTIRLKKKESK